MKTFLSRMMVVFIVLCALVIPMLSASGTQEVAKSTEKVITIGVDQEAIGIDPHIVTAFSSHRRLDLLYNRLVRLDENLVVVPDLAESWEIPNNRTYIFHLRNGS
jgi:peptide/nickel transport system substrate-binding protein